MTADIDSQVEGLKKRISDAHARQAGAEARAAVASERLASAEKALQGEFGVTFEGAAQLIREAEDDLAAEVVRVRTLLERAEASE
jgi:hypothetical protein